MHCGVDPHGHFVGVFASDLFVDLKQISVTLADGMFSQALDSVGKIEIDAATTWTNAAAFVADFLCRARRNITRRKIAVGRIFSLKIIVAIRLRDFAWRPVAVLLALRNPDASVVPQRL